MNNAYSEVCFIYFSQGDKLKAEKKSNMLIPQKQRVGQNELLQTAIKVEQCDLQGGSMVVVRGDCTYKMGCLTRLCCYRCLLTRDFVRLGRWFVQPYEGPEGVPGSSR